MKKLVVSSLVCVSLACAAPAATFADVKDRFERISKEEKGPFGKNILQGPSEKVSVLSGGTPRETLFQAAYRSPLARAAAEQEGFYLGNLFTTNYYELMGEYVFNNPYGDHPLDHEGLAAQGPKAIAKATRMAQHWVLEKHYVEQFPDSRLAQSFKFRGIAGAEFEVPYANHFFNFYLGAMDGDFQYLVAYQLITRSPIQDSPSLEKVRNLIAITYDYFTPRLPANSPALKELFALRNSIHNRLSPAVIGEIDRYLKNFPFYLAEGNTYLPQIKKILLDYYSFDASKLAKLAGTVGSDEIKAAAEQVASRGSNPDGLLALSRAAAKRRGQLGDTTKVPYAKRAATFALLADTARYLNKELAAIPAARSPQVTEAVINTIYVEGFLIKDNWEYFAKEAQASEPAKLLADVIDVAGGATLEEAFQPAYKQWLSIEPQMQYFMDNAVKSSALNTASILVEKLKGK